MLSVRHRVGVAVTTLLILFVALVAVQMVVSDRMYAEHVRTTKRLEAARDANVAILQHMTDAETGVRGYQLTGERAFLMPYDSGRVGALRSFDVVAEHTSAASVERLLAVERAAAARWMYAYAVPTVNADAAADLDEAFAAHGKRMFDQLRAANADVDAAIRAEQAAAVARERREIRLAQLCFAVLAIAFLAVALILAAVHRRYLLAPLEHLHATLRALAGGDRSARAVPAGPGEMRAVIDSLNALAAETERLLEAEQQQARRNELRQAVAAELRGGRDLATTACRVVELIGTELRADAVHGRVALGDGAGVNVRWPAHAADLAPRTVAAVLNGVPGEVLPIEGVAGAIAVPLGGDEDCPPGLLYLARPGQGWTADEQRLVAALGREVYHAVRQQRLQQRQARLIRELRQLDERKDAFVATVTHELRTPLTSILGYTEMLADGDGGELSQTQQRGLGAILRNALRLQDTVGDLLVLDRAADRSGTPVPVDLAAVLTSVYAEMAPAGQAKGLAVSVDAEPVWVSGDARQLDRAVRNLLDNAVKFTAAGGSVTCRLTATGGTACLQVTDTGIGIPPGDLPGLFVPFHRAANAMDGSVQGTGLGLAIVRTITTEHGGEVAVRSALGRGSTFTVTLPAVTVTLAPDDAVPAGAG